MFQKKLSQPAHCWACSAVLALLDEGLRYQSQVAKACSDMLCNNVPRSWQDTRGRGTGLGLCPMSAAAVLSMPGMQQGSWLAVTICCILRLAQHSLQVG